MLFLRPKPQAMERHGYQDEKRICNLCKINSEYIDRTGHITFMYFSAAKMYRFFHAIYYRLDYFADCVAACQIFGRKAENPPEGSLGVRDYRRNCRGHSACIRHRRQTGAGNGQLCQ